jgi:hypothetical protein
MSANVTRMVALLVFEAPKEPRRALLRQAAAFSISFMP